MKNWKLLFIASAMAVMLSSCFSKPEYIVQDDMVLYKYWTFSFGTRYDTLPGADPATFLQVTNWLGHDSRQVYFEDELVPGVDVASLEPVRKPVFKDKNDYYIKTDPMHVADIKSFKILKWAYGSIWAKDSRYAYYDTAKFEADVATFKAIDVFFAKDKNHVYYYSKVLPDADPATFKNIGKSFYYRDKSHIWFGSDKLKDVDYNTFKVDGFEYAHDKFGSFFEEKRDTTHQQSPTTP